MGVNPVSGYGNITSGNAKEIYIAWKHGEVNLEVSQQKYCESFLSESDWDEINYDIDSKQSEGKDKIGDAEKAEKHSDQGANAAANSAGMAAGAAGYYITSQKAAGDAGISGFIDLANGAILAACGIAVTIFANMFDSAYTDRVAACDASGDTNGIIDGQKKALESSMDSMNEDMATYNTAVQTYTENMNGNNSELANLQVRLADAEAAGDTEGAAQIREEIRALQKAGEEMDTSEMDDQRAKIQNYQGLSNESYGVSDSGATVAEFLKDGKWLGPIAAADSLALTAGFGFSTTAMYKTIADEIHFFSTFRFAEAVAAGAAIALFVVSLASVGKAITIMTSKTKHEFECGSAGSDMQTHVDSLNGMIEQQGGYIESTTGEYDNMDAESQEAIEKGKEKANSNSAANGGNPTDSKPPKAGEGNPFAPTSSASVTT